MDVASALMVLAQDDAYAVSRLMGRVVGVLVIVIVVLLIFRTLKKKK